MTIGLIVQLVSRRLGSFLVEDVPTGGKVLALDNARDFRDGDNALLRLGDTDPRSYSSRDVDQNLLTLSSGVGASIPSGTRVDPFPGGEEVWALVSEENGRPTDSIWAIVPYALRGFLLADGLRESSKRERVRYEVAEGSDRAEIVDVLNKVSSLNPDAIDDGSILGEKLADGAVDASKLAEEVLGEIGSASESAQAAAASADAAGEAALAAANSVSQSAGQVTAAQNAANQAALDAQAAQQALDDAVEAGAANVEELRQKAEAARVSAAQAAADLVVAGQNLAAAQQAAAAAQAAAQQAATDAQNAGAIAQSAYDRMGHKVIYSTNVPGSSPNEVGDTWFQRYATNGSNGILAGDIQSQWVGMGGTVWQQTVISRSVIGKIEIGVGTFGTLAGERIDVQTLRVGPQNVEGLQVALDSKETPSGAQSKADAAYNAAKALADAASNAASAASSAAAAAQTAADKAMEQAKTTIYARDPNGVSKWLLGRWYGIGNASMAPYYSNIRGKLPNETSLRVSNSLMDNGPDNYIGMARSLFTANTDRTINAYYLHDDGGSLYVDGILINAQAGYGGANFSFTVKAGTHIIDVMWAEGSGGDGVTFTPDLLTLFDGMNAPMSLDVEPLILAGIARQAQLDAIEAARVYTDQTAATTIGTAGTNSAAQVAAERVLIDQSYGETKGLVTGWRTPGQATIEGGKLRAQSVGADKVVANDLTSKQVTISDFSNYLIDITLEMFRRDYPAVDRFYYSDSPGEPNGRWRFHYWPQNTRLENNMQIGEFYDVQPGDEFYGALDYYKIPNTNTDVVMNLVGYDTTGAVVTYNIPVTTSAGIATDAWIAVSGTAKIPAGVYRVRPYFKSAANSSADKVGAVYMRNFQLRRRYNGSLIVDGTIEAKHMNIETLVARLATIKYLESMNITMQPNGRIQMGQSYWTPQAFVIPQPNGGEIRLPSDGSAAKITSDIDALSILIRDKLTLRGDNNTINGKVKIGAYIGNPTTAPTPSFTSVFKHDGQLEPLGLTMRHSLSSISDSNLSVVVLRNENSTVEYIYTINAVGAYTQRYTVPSDLSILGMINMPDNSGYLVMTYNKSLNQRAFYVMPSDFSTLSSRWQPSSASTAEAEAGRTALGWDHIAGKPMFAIVSNRQLKVWRFTMGDSVDAAETWLTDMSADNGGNHSIWFIGRGNFDYGSERRIVQSNYEVGVTVLNSSNARIPAETFYEAYGVRNARLYWNPNHATEKWRAITSSGSVNLPTAAKTSKTITATQTFYDGNSIGSTHETLPSPPSDAKFIPARMRLTLLLAAAPEAGSTAQDAANQVGIYIGSGARYRQGYVTLTSNSWSMDGELLTATGTADTSIPSNSFIDIAGGIGRMETQKGGMWYDGEGKGDWPYLRESYSIRRLVEGNTNMAANGWTHLSGMTADGTRGTGLSVPSGGVIQIVTAGWYEVAAQVSFGAANASRYLMRVVIGTNPDQLIVVMTEESGGSGGGAVAALNGSTTRYFNAGDQLRVYLYCTSGTNTDWKSFVVKAV